MMMLSPALMKLPLRTWVAPVWAATLPMSSEDYSGALASLSFLRIVSSWSLETTRMYFDS